MKTLRDSFAIRCYVKQDSLACFDEGQPDNPLGSRMAKVNALRELQSVSGDAARFESLLNENFV